MLALRRERSEIDERLVPCADPGPILELLRDRQAAGAAAVALVSHEPTCGALLGLLVHGTVREPIPLSPGMLAAVDLSDAEPGGGALQFVR